jgi:hypothetical protein
MRFFTQLLIAATLAMAANTSCRASPFPSSLAVFSSDFKQPQPPIVKAAFEASFVQHKWYALPWICPPTGCFGAESDHGHRDVNVSHITSGYIANSPEEGYVRVGQAYEDGMVSSSFFNNANISDSGLVDNTLTSYVSDSEKPIVWRDYVNPNFPIFLEDILLTAGAVFTGLVARDRVGTVAAVSHI